MRPSLRAAVATAAVLMLCAPTAATADGGAPDADTAFGGPNISYGAGGNRACATRGSAVPGQITVTYGGSSHLTAGEAIDVAFTTPAGVTATASATSVPTPWTSTSPEFTIPFTTTVTPASAGGKVEIEVTGEGSNVVLSGKPNFQVSVSCAAPVDSTPPVIGYTLNPASPGAGGWYNGPVAIDWTVTDPESTPSDCPDTSWSTETTSAGHNFTCSSTSAGGTSGPVTVNVKLDLTAPTVTPDVTGTVGANGWYTSDALVHWNIGDSLSGLSAGASCPDVPINTDQAETTYSCTVTDVAGNSTTNSVTVKRDATAPVVGRTVSGTLGLNGWYITAVTVDWTVSDAGSGIASQTGCEDVTIVDADGTVTSACSVTDNAGNVTVGDTVVAKVDSIAPVVTGLATGTAGNSPWFTIGDVTVAWSETETGSGVVDACEDDIVSADTDGTTFTCTVHDAAGNTSNEASVTVYKDGTVPTISHTIGGTLGNNGWYVTDVDVDFTTSDATSGVGMTAGCTPDPWQTDTALQSFTCTVTDVAGNVNSDTATFKRDATPPEITWLTGPANGATYDFGDPIPAATCSATDATSGVTAAGCNVSGGGTTVGSHTLLASAADEAGNSATATRSYTVNAWRLEGFYSPVDMGGVFNTVKAGSTVPLKFNVFKGTTRMTSNIGATFTATKVNCTTGSEDAIEEFATTGKTELRYDATGAQWIQNWATPTAGKGNCYRVTLTTADGSTLIANFKLK